MALTKDRKNAKLFGVCAGLGNHFGIDPAFVRLGFLLGFLFAGTGVLLYLILAIVLPNDTSA